MGNGKPIFYDEERRRWRRTRRVMEIAGALFAFVLIVFIIDIFRNPDLGASLLPDRHPIRHAIRQAKPAKVTPVRQGRNKRVAASASSPTIMTRCALHFTRTAIPPDSLRCRLTTKKSTCSFPKA